MSQQKLPRATLEQKIQTLDWFYANGTRSQQYTVNYFKKLNQFGITKSSFNRWLKDESQLRAMYKSINVNNRGIYKTRPNYKNFQIDKCLEKWFDQRIFQNQVISERLMIYQWGVFGGILGQDVAGEQKSNGWVYHFKKKMSIRKDLIVGFLNMISAMPQTIEGEMKRLKFSLNGVDASDVYQFDEVVLSTKITPMESGSMKFIVGLLCNGDGSDWVEPLVINNSIQIQPPPWNYFQSNVNIMSNDALIQYLMEWEKSLQRRVYLLLDCLYEHIVDISKFDKIQFIWFNPNFQTRYSVVNNGVLLLQEHEEIQPLNLGVIKCFKMIYKITLYQHYLNGLMTLTKLVKLSSQQVFQIIMDSFEEMKENHKSCVMQCFENSKLLSDDVVLVEQTVKPSKRQFVSKELEAKFIKILSQFEKYGIFKNNYSIDQLLFPRDEVVINKIYSDSEIVALVKMESQEPRQVSEQVNDQLVLSSRVIVDPLELQEVDKLINIDLKQFFNKNNEAFNKSLFQFNKFLNVFIKESMNLQMNQHEEQEHTDFNEVGDGNILPDLLNSR